MPQSHPNTAMVAQGASLRTSASFSHHPPRSCHHAQRHCHPPPCSLVLLLPSSQSPIILATPVILTGDVHSTPSHGLSHLNFVSLPLPPKGPITPQPIRVPFLRSPTPFRSLSETFPRLSHQRPQNPWPAEGASSRTGRAESGGAGPQPRSLFMNGGAGGARPHYYAARRALRPSTTRLLDSRAADVTEPVAGGGAGPGGVTHAASPAAAGASPCPFTPRAPRTRVEPSRAAWLHPVPKGE